MFCEKKTDKDFSFKARGLVTEAGSGKNMGQVRAYLLRIRKKHSVGRFVYLFVYFIM